MISKVGVHVKKTKGTQSGCDVDEDEELCQLRSSRSAEPNVTNAEWTKGLREKKVLKLKAQTSGTSMLPCTTAHRLGATQRIVEEGNAIDGGKFRSYAEEFMADAAKDFSARGNPEQGSLFWNDLTDDDRQVYSEKHQPQQPEPQLQQHPSAEISPHCTAPADNGPEGSARGKPERGQCVNDDISIDEMKL